MVSESTSGPGERTTTGLPRIAPGIFLPTRHVSLPLGALGGVNDGCHNYTGGVTGHNVRVLANPFVYPIFWGSAYSTRDATGVVTWEHPCIASMGDFLAALRATWLGGLNQYGVQTMGSFQGEVDTLTPGTDPSGLSQGQIEQELIRFITWSQVGVPLPNETQRCFLIMLPTTADLSDAPGACGYHGSTYYGKTSGDHNLFYAVIGTKGVSTALSGDDFINRVSYCISHELAEMFTNPDGHGWFADADPSVGRDQTCEIGDICETKGTVLTLGKWTVEKFWSQETKDCFDPSSPAPSPTPTPTPSPTPLHPHPTPQRQACQQLAVRIGQLESAILQVSREPEGPAKQTQLHQLEQQLGTVQRTYQQQCMVR